MKKNQNKASYALLGIMISGCVAFSAAAAETDYSFVDDYSKKQLLELDKTIHQKLNMLAGTADFSTQPISIESCKLVVDDSYTDVMTNLEVKIRNNTGEDITDGLSINFQLLDEQGDSIEARGIWFPRVDAGQGATERLWVEGNLSTPVEDIANIKFYEVYMSKDYSTTAFDTPYIFDGSGEDSVEVDPEAVAEAVQNETETVEKSYEGYDDCLALPKMEEVLENIDIPSRHTHKTSGVLDEILLRYRARTDQMVEYVDFLREYGFNIEEIDEKSFNILAGERMIASIQHTGSEVELSIRPDAIDIISIEAGVAAGATAPEPEYEGYEDCPAIPSAKEYLGLSSQTKTSSTTSSSDGGRSYSPVQYKYRVGSSEMEDYAAYLSECGFNIISTGDKSYDIYAGSMELGAISHDGVEMTVSIRPDVIDFTSLDDIEYTDIETVKKVQEALNAAGFECGTPDGLAGQKTADSIKAYQAANGLEENGKIKKELLDSMNIHFE